jgi:hypothetical protein
MGLFTVQSSPRTERKPFGPPETSALWASVALQAEGSAHAHPRMLGPMAQEIAQKYPDKVYEGPDGYLRIRLDDLSPGLAVFDFFNTVRPSSEAGRPGAIAFWREIFAHWDKQERCHDRKAQKEDFPPDAQRAGPVADGRIA